MLFKKSEHTYHVSFNRILKIAYPSILSMLSLNIMQFVDRMFVANFSLTQFSAIMPSSIFSMAVSSVFLGMAGYVSSLVSQYFGAEKYHQCSKSMWQGIYFSVIFSIILLSLTPLMGLTFKFLGHHESVIPFEKQFFYFMMGTSCLQLFINSIAGFFNGIGDTKIPMITQITANGLNIIFDWIFIFGNLGFKPMGIFGAGIATSLATLISLIMLVAFLNKENIKEKYEIFKHRSFDVEIFKKLLKFGFPAGLQFFLSIGAFSIFILLIGTLGDIPLTCANIAFTIEGISFLPVLGLSVAVSVISGQEKGAERIYNVSKVVKNGVTIAISYNIVMIIIFNLFPEVLISIFNSGKEAAKFEAVSKMTIPLIRLTSLWLVFDSVQIIIGSVLRTMGDMVFMLIVTGILPIFVLIIPSYLFAIVFKQPLTVVWGTFVVYAIFLSVVMSLRFKSGKWKEIQVI